MTRGSAAAPVAPCVAATGGLVLITPPPHPVKRIARASGRSDKSMWAAACSSPQAERPGELVSQA